MFHWGELNSTENDSTHLDAFHHMFRGTRVTDMSIRDGLAAFLTDPSRKVTVVTSHGRIDLKTNRVTLISSGKEHVVFVSEAGTAYEWKLSAQSNISRTFSSLTSRPIAQVVCGNNHSIVLTKDGQLFTWGENSNGQLGLGKSEPSSLSPQPLKSLCGIPLVQISAGGDHSFALSLSGAVFGWGRNSAGQLGLGDTDASLWTKLPYYYYRTVVKIFYSVCSHYISVMMSTTSDQWCEVEPALLVLQTLYNINSQRVVQLTEKYFQINELSNVFDVVKFALEDGVDYGALRAEFFTLLSKEIAKNSSAIQASEDSGLSWFSVDDSDSSLEELFYIGVICGMAFYNSNFMYMGFPVALFKKLLNIRPTLSDLEELSPVEARSLKNLLTEDEDVVELLYLDFTVKGQELVPNGVKIPVTKANRQKYVDLYVDFVFNKSVEKQFRKFQEGFSHGNPFDLWIMFKPEEFRDLLYGTSKYEWTELQQAVTYVYCTPSDQLIQNFWSVFFEVDEEHRKKFLTFVKGTDRLPVGGLSKLQLKIVCYRYEDSDDRFPSAQTCNSVFNLPNYSSVQILREKFVHAINYCEVFGQA
ncbi:putative E3 ubiquitin-protein ligase HERC4 [Bagarius yarrelli]|uniref:Putative E3 ubiquitin-protein ligase HERC4 n=1 Tax=Bagarius yarrelli TaxID=175774 RepID=A0A556TMC6_BAGYA|nr:putative E3 ubiquitin-protein ligase HERC4 [Bagarius yarrelli]